MPKRTLAVLFALLAITAGSVGSIPAGAFVSGNEPPLADAGLDQEVTKGATVLLDGTGSRDPDGQLDQYRWMIRTPGNATITPACVDCPRTEFTPTEIGRYAVTLTVTDDEGATSSDTLYVDVSPGSSPKVSVSGPQQPREGDTGTYTATFESGAAELSHVVWSVDGTEFANHSLSEEQGDDVATKHFPSATSHTITATVYDRDGQADTDTLSVEVQQRPESESETPTTGTSIASSTSPTITGDKVVTGTEPLQGEYDVKLDAPGSIASIEWKTAAATVGTGRDLTRSWSPGVHQFYAVVSYADGSENVATFGDGSTTVVADPKPNVSIGSLDRFGSITGSAEARDEYENLADLRVELDGETIATSNADFRDRYKFDNGQRRLLDFTYSDFTPGENYTVTVVAEDDRGQTSSASREIVPVKKPEIVRSEFVNDPVDSYHPRIDESRYLAHHVLEIELNGNDPQNIEIDIIGKDSPIKEIKSDSFPHKKEKKNNIRVDSFWIGEVTGKYKITISLATSSKYSNIKWVSTENSYLNVTPSEPELRLDVINDGTKEYSTKNHGIKVNASDSFDPDKTNLKYIWKYGAEPTKPDNTTAKFRAYENAASIIEDEYDLRTKRNFDFLNYYLPSMGEGTVASDGPYAANDTVEVQLSTEPYHFSKKTYYEDFALDIEASNPKIEIKNWREVDTGRKHREVTEYTRQYKGTIEIPASELVSRTQDSTVTIYNKGNHNKKTQIDLAETGVLVKEDEYWRNPTVRNLSYFVERPEIEEITVESEDNREELLQDGYYIRENGSKTKHQIEERVKIRDAKYETRTKQFRTSKNREIFLKSTTDWSPAGITERQETRTRRYSEWHSASKRDKSEWHDSNLENGELTSKTREVVVEPAEYRTKHQYRYEYQTERTGTRTVTRTRTVPVTKTGTRQVTRCTKYGCYKTTETYTYTTRKTYTYTTTETYTYTVTETDTYWATSKYDQSHTATGRTKRIKIDDAVYETQYKIQYETDYTKTVTYYEALKKELVRDAVYEWRVKSTVQSLSLARQIADRREDLRISAKTIPTWTLAKEIGTQQVWTSEYDNENSVIKTTATIGGNVTIQYMNSTGERVTEEKEAIEKFSIEEAKSKTEILEIMTPGDEDPNWCKMKPKCSN